MENDHKTDLFHQVMCEIPDKFNEIESDKFNRNTITIMKARILVIMNYNKDDM